MLQALFRAGIAVAMLAASQAVPAFGGVGHRLIAELAEARLTPAARAEATRLLAQEPGATLMSVSTWADENRTLSTAAWHYLNFPRGEPCQYQPARLCIEGNCVVGALQTQLALLASAASDADRLLALKYVVHLVADVHQPLHAGFFDDRGGNSYQLQAYERGTNLHALWDSALLQQWPGGIAALKEAMEQVAVSTSSSNPRVWAETSCRVVAAAGFYPEQRTLEASYPAQWNDQLARQLGAAGQRLAEALNAALAGK